jgi:hypothetical protein
MINASRNLVGIATIAIALATSPLQAQTADRVEFIVATHNNNMPGSKQLDDGKSFGLS